MPAQEYEYMLEPVSISPDELRNERFSLETMLNDRAADGWVLDDTLRVDSSTFMFLFRRSVDASN